MFDYSLPTLKHYNNIPLPKTNAMTFLFPQPDFYIYWLPADGKKESLDTITRPRLAFL